MASSSMRRASASTVSRASPSPTCWPGAGHRHGHQGRSRRRSPGRVGGRAHAGRTDDLGDRLREYGALGARFAKWRRAIPLSDRRPSPACLRDSAQAFARFAAICQQRSLVPIVAPEVMMDGVCTIERSEEVIGAVLRAIFRELRTHGVHLEALVLTSNMVVPGTMCSRRSTPEEVAAATIRCLRRHVPAAVPGVAFVSGDQGSVRSHGPPQCHRPTRWAGSLGADLLVRACPSGRSAHRLGRAAGSCCRWSARIPAPRQPGGRGGNGPLLACDGGPRRGRLSASLTPPPRSRIHHAGGPPVRRSPPSQAAAAARATGRVKWLTPQWFLLRRENKFTGVRLAGIHGRCACSPCGTTPEALRMRKLVIAIETYFCWRVVRRR